MNLNKENDIFNKQNQNYSDIFLDYINLKRKELNFESSGISLYANYQRRKASYIISKYDNGNIAKLPYYLLLCHIYRRKISSDKTKNMEKYLELDEITSFLASFDNNDFCKVQRFAHLIKEWLELDFYTSHRIVDKYIHSVPTPLLNRLKTTTVKDYKNIITEANTTKEMLNIFPGSLNYLYDLRLENHANNIFSELDTVKRFYLPFLESCSKIDEEEKRNLLKEFWPLLEKRIQEDQNKSLFYYPSASWLPDYKIFMDYIIIAYKDFCSKKFYIEGSEKSLIDNSIKIPDTISSIDKLIKTLSDKRIKNTYQDEILRKKERILNELETSLSVEAIDQLLHNTFCDSSVSVMDILDKIAVSASIRDIHNITILLFKQLDSFTDAELGVFLLEEIRNRVDSDDAYQLCKLYK